MSTATALAVLALAGSAATASTASAAGNPVVRLSVSNSSPVQGTGVTFDASAISGSAIQGYLFSYGDGLQETTYQNVMLHAYSDPGTYYATVAALDASGHVGTSTPVQVTVRDGVAPVVRITSPTPDQHAHLGRSGFTIRGAAVDPGAGASGVRKVQLALEYLSVSGNGGCPWFDGHHSLKPRGCTNALWFNATLSNGQFSFRLSPRLAWPTGLYALRVRGADRAGNVSQFYAIKLRTILGFRLSR